MDVIDRFDAITRLKSTMPSRTAGEHMNKDLRNRRALVCSCIMPISGALYIHVDLFPTTIRGVHGGSRKSASTPPPKPANTPVFPHVSDKYVPVKHTQAGAKILHG
jgi:hypothetical protein